MRHQRIDDCRGDFVLHGKNIGELPVEGLRPEVVTVLDIDQLRRDAKLGAGLANRTLEHSVDVELFADVLDGLVLSLEGE